VLNVLHLIYETKIIEFKNGIVSNCVSITIFFQAPELELKPLEKHYVTPSLSPYIQEYNECH
jgi:hypothetical protein